MNASSLTLQIRCLNLRFWTSLLVILALAIRVAHGAEDPAKLTEFKQQRAQMLRDLAAAPSVCVARHDTEHPVFHGCIDWHSSAHGIWSLVAAGDALHDSKLLESAKNQLDVKGIESERQYLHEHPHFEMPYGRAWFLRLAVDFERVTGDTRLAQMASDVATSMTDYLFAGPIDPSSRSYSSETWALINLQYYAQWKKDEALLARIRSAAERYYFSVQGPCPALPDEARATDFMAICTNWAWVVSLYMKPQQFHDWVSGFLPPGDAAMAPVTDPTTAHHHGIDFSRGWGLWAVYQATRDPRYLDLYLAHVRTAYEHHDWWAGSYESVAHWVAQFGILALYLSYQDDP